MDAFEKKVGRDEVVNILRKHPAVKEANHYDLMALAYLDPNGLIDQGSTDAQRGPRPGPPPGPA